MNIITQVLLPLILAFIMFSMGLSLKTSDFSNIFKKPKAFTIGFLLQIISLPVLGFLIAWIWINYFNLSPIYGVGIIIIASCPGGVTSNLMTHLVKGDTALSISLTAVTSLLSVITIPIFVNIGLKQFLGTNSETSLEILNTVIGIFFITTVPVIIGMVIHHFKEEFALKWEPLCRNLATAFFIIIILAAVAKDFKTLMGSLNTIGPSVLTMNILTMLLAFGVSKLLTLQESQGRAITLECGLQNGTLAIFVAATLLNNLQMMLPGVVYGLLMFATSGVYMILIKRKISS